MPAREKCVIIDDFQDCRLNAKGQRELLELLSSLFGVVVLIGSDTLLISEAFAESAILADYGCLEIREFGHRLTEHLIEKWLSVGQEYTILEQVFLQRVIQMKTLLDSVVGRALIPRRPIYLLILLQQIEANAQLDSASGSFGYLYEALVTRQLSRAARRYTLDTLHNYLSELAYSIFESGTKHISESSLKEFHDRYVKTYRIGIDLDGLIKDLERLNIVRRQSDVFRFHYKYLYYFFVAKYIASHITETSIRAYLDQMTERLHRDDYSTILLFTAYFVKDPYLIENVLRSARKLFANYEPCDFEAQVAFVNRLQSELPRFILPEKDTRSRREEVHQKIDDWYKDMSPVEDQAEFELEESREQAEILNVARAFKAVQILGQILRNFPGSLKGDVKLDLAKEAYALGLRTLSGILSIIEQNTGFLVGELAKVVRETNSTREERVEKATQLLCYITELVSFIVVKRVSWSVGSRHLVETYEDLLRESRSVAVRLVDLSIRLDHFATFPEHLILEVHQRVEGNLFAEMTLRQLVAQHLYLYPTEYRATQRVCAKLGIAFKDVSARQRLR